MCFAITKQECRGPSESDAHLCYDFSSRDSEKQIQGPIRLCDGVEMCANKDQR